MPNYVFASTVIFPVNPPPPPLSWQIVSTVVDVVVDEHAPTFDAKLCFDPSTSSGQTSDMCLGYYDEDQNRWVCEDHCLTQEGGKLCGKTSHFTMFALLLSGRSGLSSDPCGSDSTDYITGVWWGDLTLMVSLLVVAVLFVLLASISFYIPGLKKIWLGEEGVRVKKSREHSMSIRSRTSV